MANFGAGECLLNETKFYILTFRTLTGFIFPVDLEEDLMVVLPSLVNLARTAYQYGYVIGAIERSSNKFLDCYCYSLDDAEYDMYWSSAEALTQTQSTDSEYQACSTEDSD